MKRSRITRSHPPQDQKRSPRPKWLIGLGAALIVAVTLWVYLPAMRSGFIWNDNTYDSWNPVLTKPGGLLQIWSLRWRTSPDGQRYLAPYTEQYYPMVFSSFWLESRLWSNSNPTGFHVVNVLLHIANALLIWLICRRLGFSWGYIMALIFALHPVEIESVAWITERKNVLSGLFYLLALLSYLRFDRTSRKAFYWSSFACFVLALLSKTVTCTLPVILLLLLWLRHGRIARKDVLRMIPFFVVGALLGLFTAYLERHSVGAGAQWEQIAFWQRLVIAGRAVFFYISKLLWPMKLIFIYPRWNPPDFSLFDLLWPTAAMLITAGLCYWRRTIGRAAIVAWAAFVVSLFPALGFVDVYPFRFSFVADHFQYLASMFFIALVVGLVHELYKHLCRQGPLLSAVRSAAIALAIVVVGLLGWLSWAHTSIYQNPKHLWLDTIEKNPQAWLAWNNLGQFYAELGNYPKAIEAYEQAVLFKPDLAIIYSNLGLAYGEVGRYAEAVKTCREAIRIKPDLSYAHNNLGVIYVELQRYPEALAEFRTTLRIKPDYVSAHLNLGNLYAQLGRNTEAVEAYKTAVAIQPDFADAHNNLGHTYHKLGRYSDAIKACKQALRIRPNDALALYNVARAYLALDDGTSALKHWEKLKRLDKPLADKLGKELAK